MALPRFLIAAVSSLVIAASAPAQRAPHRFEIGETDFLLDGKPFVIRSGEMHAARIPREYWRHRLEMVRAMGCNTVCAYLFWSQHEPREGSFDFTGQADVAEYCRLAQAAGLWVILRPGPYACAEWDFGGFPWWLLKTKDIALRTRDARYLDPARRYLLRVGKELAPLQVTHGGPILMVQVENEYGSYGTDREYLGVIRDALVGAGFAVPLFTCDGPSQLERDVRPDIFSVVNFGSDPENAFRALRAVRPKGPLLCGEYYPGWFDSWGMKHHTGDASRVVDELGRMLDHRQSFSIYMAHGGTSFGFSSGANSPPFRPQSTSYDYDAPIDEAGRATPKFHAIRALFAKHLNDGEALTDPPTAMPTIALPAIRLTAAAALFDNLGASRTIDAPVPMEMLDQAQGTIVYRTTLPAGEPATLLVCEAHDLAAAYLDGVRVGAFDRRFRKRSVTIPARVRQARLDLVVDAMGRVNYGADLHDRKGITEKVELTTSAGTTELRGFEVFSLPFDAAYLASLRFRDVTAALRAPAVYRGTFTVAKVGDTFLDLRGFPRGMVWVNGRNLGRYWSIGPQQTLYCPGCWLRAGSNEILVLDATGDLNRLALVGQGAPILDQLGLDPLAPARLRRAGEVLDLGTAKPVATGAFAPGTSWQDVAFPPTTGRYVCFEATSSLSGDAFTTVAEITLRGEGGAAVASGDVGVAWADSEELDGDDGSAGNAHDGDPATFWHTEWQSAKPAHPHTIVLDVGRETTLTGLRYLPRQDGPNGRIKDYRVYVSVKSFVRS